MHNGPSGNAAVLGGSSATSTVALMAGEHLFGAFGMFWERDSVDWSPGVGGRAWQLLGFKGERRPGLRLCDFRPARGFYILFDDHGAHYVGIARGEDGLGARLQKHHAEKSTWSRFCWFAFDDVVDGDLDGWSRVQKRDAVASASPDLVVRECEALLIEVLGTGRILKDVAEGRQIRVQNGMNFAAGAVRWEQLREGHFQPGGVAHKADASGFTDRWLRDLAELDQD